MQNRLHICQTCTRDGARESDGRTRGQHLTDEVVQQLDGSDLKDRLVVRKVPCLSGCLSSCNVSFRAGGKTSLRFSCLSKDNAADVLAFARLYLEAAGGEVAQSEWPDSLKSKLTSRTPAPG